jgi:hypothetical protein
MAASSETVEAVARPRFLPEAIPKVPEVPGTIVGVLEELEKAARSSSEISEQRSLQLGSELLAIYQEGLERYRAIARRRREDWSGRLDFLSGNPLREQDGHWWGNKDIVLIKGNAVGIISSQWDATRDAKENTVITAVMSRDGKVLDSVEYWDWKTFGEGEKKETLILFQATVELGEDNRIQRAEFRRNASIEDPFGGSSLSFKPDSQKMVDYQVGFKEA